MAYASELVGVGMSPGTASGIGGTYNSVVAAGSTQANATPITASMAVVTAADGTKGAILVGQAGDEVWVFNSSASTLKVYPPTGAAIAVVGTGLGTVNAAFSQLTFKTTIYKCLTSTQWLANTSA